MSEVLRLHGQLYAASAIDRAVEMYAKHASIVRSEQAPHVLLTIDSDRPQRAQRVARELANYALGLTVQAQSSTETKPSTETRPR